MLNQCRTVMRTAISFIKHHKTLCCWTEIVRSQCYTVSKHFNQKHAWLSIQFLPKRRRALATALMQPMAWATTQDSWPFRKLGERCSPISRIAVKPISKSRDATPVTNMLVTVWRKWKRLTEVRTRVFPNTIIKMTTAYRSTTPQLISKIVSLGALEVASV